MGPRPFAINHRRERLAPTCPVPPLLAFPMAIGAPFALDSSAPEFEPLPNFGDDPFALPLPQLPPAGQLVEQLKAVAVVGAAAYLYLKFLTRR